LTLAGAPLGHRVAYSGAYDPGLLFPIARAPNRDALGLDRLPPMHGADIWTAYELSWLNPRGKPQVAMAVFTVPADSPSLIESKSLKLYLNSYNQTRLDGPESLSERLRRDLSAAAGAPVALELIGPEHFGQQRIAELEGEDLDRLDVDIDAYQPAPGLLRVTHGEPREETLCSRLLKSNCPVTGQPDWASVQIRYRGRPIDHASLLRYIVSFRQHAGFHEHCVETLYASIMRACAPDALTVVARYTRRGGLDINPWRGSSAAAAARITLDRTARQ
jgi:7-cyano-7-deazaguanine reductase